MSRALVLGPGGLRGAYGGGVVATLGRKLGCDYFDSVYACSAGSYTGSYFVAGQPDIIESIWRECVYGELLVRWHNIFHHGHPILDLFYLNNVLRNGMYRLSMKDFLNSPVRMFMVATECYSGVARYFSPKTPEEFFLQVRASAAVPYLHKEVSIEGRNYIDGGLSDPLPIERALSDGHNEIVVVWNNQKLTFGHGNLFALAVLTMGYQGRRQMLRSLAKMQHDVAFLIEKNKARVRVVLPSRELPVRWQFDSSKTRINQLVDLGIHDALAFLA